MRQRGTVLTGLGLGIALIYLLHPERGGHRRARVRDRIERAVRLGGTAVAAGRDVLNRTSDAATRVRATLPWRSIDDSALIERVRAQIAYVVSHPHAIDVESTDGVVILRGPILHAETSGVLNAVKLVRGVRQVISELEKHKMTWNVPALHGGSTPPGLPSDNGWAKWSSQRRLLTGTTGIALAGYGAARHDARGALLALTGMALVARAAAA